MNLDDFVDSPSGQLVPTVQGQKAFVPNPLPPNFDTASILHELSAATAAIGELRGACRLLANPYILIRPLQRLEAQTSSAMEGTYTAADELVMAETGMARSPSAETIEVNNYIRALSWAVEKLKELPVSVRLIKGAHAIMLENVARERGRNKQPGEFTSEQNMIGGRNIRSARFVPPPAAESAEAMSDLEKYINRPDKSGSLPLIDLALVHYQFETIHPFADGNGRVGRMLISLMALSEGLLEMPVLYMSPELEERKDEYIDRMYEVSSRGAWEDYLGFFFTVLAESCKRTIETIDRILALQKEYHARARAKSRSNNMNAVLNMLFEWPVIQPKQIVDTIGITDAAARNLLRQLVSAGILIEVPGSYPTIWFADELLRVSRPQ